MSYDDTLPTDKDVVRMYLGDTHATELLSDAHINAVLTLGGSVAAAVVILARELLAMFANRPARVTLPNGLSVGWDRAGWVSLIASGGVLDGASGAFSHQMTRSDGYADRAAESA